MTFTTTILIGVGILFIASALDDTPILDTARKIISGQTIDWTGGSGSNTSGSLPNTPTTPQNPGGGCPPGYILVNGVCTSTAGI
jgi:hypothetical protein